MKGWKTIGLASLAAFGGGVGASPENSEERILLAGDSWAAFLFSSYSLPEALSLFGHPSIEVLGANTTLSGSTAAQWASLPFLNLLSAELAAHPSVDVVQLSLGANDFVVAWNAFLTPAEELQLFDAIVADVAVVVDHVLAERPDVRIVLQGYDYANLDELAPIGSPVHAYWVSIGSPSTLDVNQAYVELGARIRDLASGHPRVDYLHNFGLMQAAFGYPSLGVPPLATPLPGTQPNFTPFPGGVPAFPSPPEAMLDAAHLSGLGYDFLGLWAVFTFYDAYFDGNP